MAFIDIDYKQFLKQAIGNMRWKKLPKVKVSRLTGVVTGISLSFISSISDIEKESSVPLEDPWTFPP